MVSSDKDLMQLVADGVELWDPMKQKNIGRAEVIEKFGVGPELVRDALALIGDTSDNVPGVPGIGPKSAAQLLTEYGSLEGLLANLDQIKQPKRREVLQANAEKARLSYRLVCLADDAPLPLGLEELRRRPSTPGPAGLPAAERLPLPGRPGRGRRRRGHAGGAGDSHRPAAARSASPRSPTWPISTPSSPARSRAACWHSTPRPPRSTSRARSWSASASR